MIDGDVLGGGRAKLAEGRQAKIPLMLGLWPTRVNSCFLLMCRLPKRARWVSKLSSRRAGGGAGYTTSRTSRQTASACGIDRYLHGFAARREYQALAKQPTYLYFMDHVPPAFHLYMPEQPYPEMRADREGWRLPPGIWPVFGSLDKVGYDWTDEDKFVSEHVYALTTYKQAIQTVPVRCMTPLIVSA